MNENVRLLRHVSARVQKPKRTSMSTRLGMSTYVCSGYEGVCMGPRVSACMKNIVNEYALL